MCVCVSHIITMLVRRNPTETRADGCIIVVGHKTSIDVVLCTAVSFSFEKQTKNSKGRRQATVRPLRPHTCIFLFPQLWLES